MRRAREGVPSALQWLTFFVLFTGCGCSRRQEAPYPTWIDVKVEEVPNASSSNAFDGYALAALETEKLVKADKATSTALTRTFFDVPLKRKLIAILAPQLLRIEKAADRKLDFRFVPTLPGELRSYRAAWNLLGQASIWRIEAAAGVSDFDTANRIFLKLLKFGFDLTAGDAADGSLGMHLVDAARRTLAPSLPKMGAGQLGELAQGIVAILKQRPASEIMVRNEHQNMLAYIQFVQNSSRSNDFSKLEKMLGPDARAAIDYLVELKRQDSAARVRYFEAFASEADIETDWCSKAVALPASERTKPPFAETSDTRPWRRFSRHFFRSLRPVIDVRDATLARTQLLAVHAMVLRRIKLSRAAPKQLDQIAPWLMADPYTGKPFIYHAEGATYRLYSVGDNFRDDGGETDESWTHPDLLVEFRN